MNKQEIITPFKTSPYMDLCSLKNFDSLLEELVVYSEKNVGLLHEDKISEHFVNTFDSYVTQDLFNPKLVDYVYMSKQKIIDLLLREEKYELLSSLQKLILSIDGFISMKIENHDCVCEKEIEGIVKDVFEMLSFGYALDEEGITIISNEYVFDGETIQKK